RGSDLLERAMAGHHRPVLGARHRRQLQDGGHQLVDRGHGRTREHADGARRSERTDPHPGVPRLMRWLRRHPKAAVAAAAVLAVGVGAGVGGARSDDAKVRARAAGPAVAAAAPAGALVDADGAEPLDATGAAVASSVAVVGEPAGPDAVLARVFDPETGVGTD